MKRPNILFIHVDQMHWEAVKANGLKPDLGIIQSWYKHPEKDLPENKPYSFMYLAKEFIEENKKKDK